MEDLFVYGTLMCEDVMRSVAGVLPRSSNAWLRGYRRFEVRGEHYPGMVAAEGCVVNGVVYHDLPQESWARLDAFEGNMYLRRIVDVQLESGAWAKASAYVVQKEWSHLLGERDWDFDRFKQSGKTAFIDNYRGFSDIS